MDLLNWASLLALMLALGGQTGECANPHSRKLLGNSSNPEDAKVTAMIANGFPASPGQYPFFVSLNADTPIDPAQGFYQYCGGSLVAQGVVLTAAHCLFDPNSNVPGTQRKPAFVRIGLTDATNASATTRHVVSMLPHPKYNYADTNNGYDVGLLLLDQPVTGVPVVALANTKAMRKKCSGLGRKQAVCAGKKVTLQVGQPLTVMGFGSTPTTFLSKNLMQTTVKYVSWQTCQKYYSPLGLDLQSTTLCAGSTTASDACVGDSGGPLITQAPTPVQVGVVSFGPEDCGGSNHLGAYADVASMHDWIASTILSLSAPPAQEITKRIT